MSPSKALKKRSAKVAPLANVPNPAPGKEIPHDHICKECGTDRVCPLCDERICVLCGSPLLGSYGLDPRPLAYTGRCCHSCDTRRLLPFRGGLRGTPAMEFSACYAESLKRLENQWKQP